MRRARVAPPVNEAEDEGSFQDKFLPPEPPARRRGRGRARGRARRTGRRRQRDLQEDEPAESDFEEAEFVAQAPHGAVPIPPAVPQMQPRFSRVCHIRRQLYFMPELVGFHLMAHQIRWIFYTPLR